MFEPIVTVVHPDTGESVIHTSEVPFDSLACGLTEWLKEWYHTAVHISTPKNSAWISLNAGCDTDITTFIMSLDRTPEALSWVETRTIRATLQVTMVDTPNPSWQNMKVSYHRCPARYFGDKPRMTMSMQGFLQKILRIEPTQGLLETIHEMRFYQPPMPVASDYEFRWYRGDNPCAEQVFTKVYTNIPSGLYRDHYPSVLGSCMRHRTWEFRDMTIGDPPYRHPAATVATPDIAIAWLEDKRGYTVARTLVNLKTKTLVRVYAVASLECTCETHRQRYFDGLAEILKSHMPDYTLDESTGLLECRVNPYEIVDGAWVALYLDGLHKVVDLDSMTVVSCRTNKYIISDHHLPPVCGTNGSNVEAHLCTCWDCGEGFGGDPYYYNDHTLCEYCYENNYGYCECCDSTVPTDDLYYIEDLDCHYCSACLGDTFTCVHCDNRFHIESEEGTTEHDEFVCTDCALRHYSVCDHCEHLYPNGDTTEYDGECLCPDCYAEAVATDEKEISNEQ
jgi:hypothetical protein